MLLPPTCPTPPPSPWNGPVPRRDPALRYNVTTLKREPVLGIVAVVSASVAFGLSDKERGEATQKVAPDRRRDRGQR